MAATDIRPFQIQVSDAELDDLKRRILATRWPETELVDDWTQGIPLAYMQEIANYWANKYDWRERESKLNAFAQFKTDIEGLDIHFIHVRSEHENALPLIITHGWPGSVVEFLEVIEPLAHPERFGGSEDDAFDVIAPSLPGFGFSGKPRRPIGPRKMASLFAELMTGVLGYDGYLAQGGDWGGAISSWLGYEHAPACRGIHINIMTMRHADGPQGAQEVAWATRFEEEQELEMGYRTQQATKPQTLSYAMMDSPVGVAAWIIEKWNSWSDTEGDDIESVYTKDRLLANIMVYLVTGTFNTASWIYYGRREEGGRLLSPEGKRVEVPTGCARFPAELLSWPPRSYVERVYNVTHWTEMPCGGHFAAMEQPDLLIEDIRTFARALR